MTSETDLLSDFAILHQLPTDIMLDIKQRIQDWICSGGSYDDEYIKQQFKYARNVLNKLKN